MKKNDLDMHDCRGQSFVSSANIVENQRHPKSYNRRIFEGFLFNPCGYHSLNLVVSEAATGTVKPVSLFVVIQSLFVFFSSSTKRWEVISKHSEALTLNQAFNQLSINILNQKVRDYKSSFTYLMTSTRGKCWSAQYSVAIPKIISLRALKTSRRLNS